MNANPYEAPAVSETTVPEKEGESLPILGAMVCLVFSIFASLLGVWMIVGVYELLMRLGRL